jgi:hypothetical protein
MGGLKKIRTTEKKKTIMMGFSGEVPKDVLAMSKTANTEKQLSAILAKIAKENIANVLDVGITMAGIILNNIIVRIDRVLMANSFCWTRLLRTTHVDKDRIRNVNRCVLAAVKMCKSGEDKLPTCDKETIECILCAVFALVANSRDTIAEIGNQIIRDSDESMRPALLARETEFMEVLDNIVAVFRDVGLFKRSPPRVVVSKDETYIILMIGSPLKA